MQLLRPADPPVTAPCPSRSLGRGSVPDRRTVRLQASPSSAARARAVLRDVLRAAGGEAWLEAAELACTEVVSNVVLHAHTEMELVVEVRQDHVRVEVRDFSPVLPVARDYDEQAITGRGMALVAALTDTHGVSDAEPHGKTVWFVVSGNPAEQSEQDLLAARADADWDPQPVPEPAAPQTSAVAATVMLLGLPPRLWMSAREHHDALLRELALYLAAHDSSRSAEAAGPAGAGVTGPAGHDAARRDRAGVDLLGADLAGVDLAASELVRWTLSGQFLDALEDAMSPSTTAEPCRPATIDERTDGHVRPSATLDVSLRLPKALAGAVSTSLTTLRVAERLAAEGVLLEEPGSPELLAIRDWVFLQVLHQLAGGAPARWTPGSVT